MLLCPSRRVCGHRFLGLNFLDIACQDSPAVSEQPNGDPQTFPLGLWDNRISTM
jgi:hypothetical protein